jgi:hypothetical protein
VDPEPLNHAVPQRAVMTDQQAFRERDPDVVDHEVTTPKVVDVKVARRVNGLSMLAETVVELSARVGVEPEESSSSPRGEGPSNVDRPGAVFERYGRVDLEVSLVVDRVDPSAGKGCVRGERLTRPDEQSSPNASSQFDAIKRVEAAC